MIASRTVFAFILAITLFGSAAFAQEGVTRLKTTSGVTALVKQESVGEFVAICVFVKAGVAEEDGVTGIGNLVARSLFGSNESHSREGVQQSIQEVGGSLEAIWNPDYTLITCVTHRSAVDDALYLIGQAIRNPDFDPETLREALKGVETDAKREGTESFRVAYAALRARLFEDGPYRLPFGGSMDNQRKLNQATCKAYFNKRFIPSNTVVSIVGNVQVDKIEDSLKSAFFDYDRTPPRPTRVIKSQTTADRSLVRRTANTATDLVATGFRCPGLRDKDYPVAKVLEAIMGGGKSSRLFRKVRDSAGLGYAVGSYMPSLSTEGMLMAYVEYAPNHVGADGNPITPDAVVALITDSVQSLIKDPPTNAELERAKRYAAGVHQLAHQRARDRAFYLGWMEIAGPGALLDSDLPLLIAKVTIDDLKRVATKSLAFQASVVVTPAR
ncbi:MAG: pitrilysin family protein [Chthonomonadales bacterium]